MKKGTLPRLRFLLPCWIWVLIAAALLFVVPKLAMLIVCVWFIGEVLITAFAIHRLFRFRQHGET